MILVKRINIIIIKESSSCSGRNVIPWRTQFARGCKPGLKYLHATNLFRQLDENFTLSCTITKFQKYFNKLKVLPKFKSRQFSKKLTVPVLPGCHRYLPAQSICSQSALPPSRQQFFVVSVEPIGTLCNFNKL